MNQWIQHVKAYQAKHPNLTYKECLKKAKKTYKSQKGRGPSSAIAEGVSKALDVSSGEVIGVLKKLSPVGVPLLGDAVDKAQEDLKRYIKAQKNRELIAEKTRQRGLKIAQKIAKTPKSAEDFTRDVKYYKGFYYGR